MARLEEEHPPGPPVPATPRPEDLATGERRDEDQFIRRWNVEGFRVHLFSGNHEPIAQTSRDRVILLNHPHMRRLLVLTPSGNASRMSKQFLEGTGIQRRVQGKEPHPTLLHVTENAFQSCILNLAVLQVSEPHKNVGPLKISLGDPLVGISKVCDAGLEVMTRLGKDLGDDAVDKGVRMKISSWTRHDHNTMPPAAKTVGNYVNSSLAKVEALKAGYDEAIMLSPSGLIAECTGENIFCVRNGIILTPPLSAGALEGITQSSVTKIARDLGFDIRVDNIARSDLYIADEIFVCGTAAEVGSVSSVDDREVPCPGPMTKAIATTYAKAVRGQDDRYKQWCELVK